jgi:hypothetical protein
MLIIANNRHSLLTGRLANIENKIIIEMSLSLPEPPRKGGHLKLIKDLKYGKVHLRQSLIELSEFEDVNKLFKNKK